MVLGNVLEHRVLGLGGLRRGLEGLDLGLGAVLTRADTGEVPGGVVQVQEQGLALGALRTAVRGQLLTGQVGEQRRVDLFPAEGDLRGDRAVLDHARAVHGAVDAPGKGGHLVGQLGVGLGGIDTQLRGADRHHHGVGVERVGVHVTPGTVQRLAVDHRELTVDVAVQVHHRVVQTIRPAQGRDVVGATIAGGVYRDLRGDVRLDRARVAPAGDTEVDHAVLAHVLLLGLQLREVRGSAHVLQIGELGVAAGQLGGIQAARLGAQLEGPQGRLPAALVQAGAGEGDGARAVLVPPVQRGVVHPHVGRRLRGDRHGDAQVLAVLRQDQAAGFGGQELTGEAQLGHGLGGVVGLGQLRAIHGGGHLDGGLAALGHTDRARRGEAHARDVGGSVEAHLVRVRRAAGVVHDQLTGEGLLAVLDLGDPEGRGDQGRIGLVVDQHVLVHGAQCVHTTRTHAVHRGGGPVRGVHVVHGRVHDGGLDHLGVVVLVLLLHQGGDPGHVRGGHGGAGLDRHAVARGHTGGTDVGAGCGDVGLDDPVAAVLTAGGRIVDLVLLAGLRPGGTDPLRG